MKKRVIAAVVLAAAVGLMAGCSSHSEESKEASNTIQFLLPEDLGPEDAMSIAIEDWKKETGNNVDIIIISHDDQLTKFPAMAKNKDLPDIISTTRLHQLYPEEFVDMSTVVDTSQFEDSALKIVGKDYSSDKISGLPRQFTTTAFFYNKDAFEKAGIQAPTENDPWTLDELYENAAKLQADGGVKYGFACDVSRARYDVLMYENGGSLVEKDGDTFQITVNSPQNVDTLTQFVKENENGIMPKAIWAGGSNDNPLDYFKNGDVGILLSGSWNYSAMEKDIKNFNFGVLESPKGTAGQASIIGGEALAVPEDAPNKELALEFIKWMYTPENFKKYLQNDKGLSSMKGMVYEPDDEKKAEDFAMLQKESSYVTDSFMVDESSAWRNYKDNEYRDYIKRAVSGEMTPQEALDAFAKELSESSGWKIAQ